MYVRKTGGDLAEGKLLFPPRCPLDRFLARAYVPYPAAPAINELIDFYMYPPAFSNAREALIILVIACVV